MICHRYSLWIGQNVKLDVSLHIEQLKLKMNSKLMLNLRGYGARSAASISLRLALYFDDKVRRCDLVVRIQYFDKKLISLFTDVCYS
jgi:hypothetical protein